MPQKDSFRSSLDLYLLLCDASKAKQLYYVQGKLPFLIWEETKELETKHGFQDRVLATLVLCFFSVEVVFGRLWVYRNTTKVTGLNPLL